MNAQDFNDTLDLIKSICECHDKSTNLYLDTVRDLDHSDLVGMLYTTTLELCYREALIKDLEKTNDVLETTVKELREGIAKAHAETMRIVDMIGK